MSRSVENHIMIKKRKILPSDPDVTAYSDIAFLLIIFFILTTNFSMPFGRVIDMPSGSRPEEQKAESQSTPSVNILSDRIMFGEGDTEGAEITTYALRQALAQYGFYAKPEKDRMVVVEVAEDVPYQRYYEIVMMIAETGGMVAMIKD